MVSRLLAAVLVGSLVGATQSADILTHAGAVVDSRNGDPISGAQATAYGTDKKAADTACPQYEELLDTRRADIRGNFAFVIKTDHASYHAVYCANGYQSRPQGGNDNRRDNTRVSPDPVKLHPTRVALKTQGVDPVDAAVQAIVRALDGASGDLAYFRAADPSGFDAALKQFDAPSRDAATALLARKAPPSVRPAVPGQSTAARQAVARVLDMTAADLRYFGVASGGATNDAIPKLTAADRQIVTMLLARPASTGIGLA